MVASTAAAMDSAALPMTAEVAGLMTSIYSLTFKDGGTIYFTAYELYFGTSRHRAKGGGKDLCFDS
jgi:hypothetical protein